MLRKIKKVRQIHNQERTFFALHFRIARKPHLLQEFQLRQPDITSGNVPKFSQRSPITHFVVNTPKEALAPTLGTTGLKYQFDEIYIFKNRLSLIKYINLVALDGHRQAVKNLLLELIIKKISNLFHKQSDFLRLYREISKQ